MFIITSADSTLRTDADLQSAEDYRLGIPSHTSGVAVTFNYMTRQIPDLSSVQIVYGDTAEAFENMHSPNAALDAVMVVHRPKEHSPEVDLALADPERYRFLEIDDNRLTEKPDDGQEVYRGMQLAMSGQDNQEATTVKTICVKGLLLANKNKLTPEQRTLLIEVVNYQWMEVFATQ